MTIHDSLETTHAMTREELRPELDPRAEHGVGGALDKQLIKQALFPRRADLARIGRYSVLGRVGRGGMGVVYACYDPLLDRKVAVKLLHVEGGELASARLQREAQALAKLSHPNVVAIHDVGTIGERVYLAMEFVDGQALSAWLRASPRGWRDILRVILAAGEGLAAAHEKGLVHRDIKPDNLMIDNDGRVRVMDFGLAYLAASPGPRPPVDLDAVTAKRVVSLTKTGALMGTPAYMAGEQFLGAAIDARTDQFSLCATAWEALHRQPAFAGDSLNELAGNVTGGLVAPPPARSDVPMWLRRVLLRGLRPNPDDRYPDTRALLQALRADPTRRRRIVGGALGLAALALIGAGVYEAGERRRVAACEAAGAVILDDWHDDARLRLERSFHATGRPYAASTYARTVPWFDRWTAAWRSAAVAACAAHTVDATWDADLRARADDCLDEARGHFTALIAELSDVDDAGLARATAAAAGLPAIAACTEPAVLRMRPMMRPELRTEVLAVRAELARAASLEAAGAYPQGRTIADDAVVAARDIGWAPLVAQAELRAAALAERSGDYAGSEAGLRRTLVAAREARAPDLALTATIDMVFVGGYRVSHPAEGKVWAESARTQLELLGGDLPLARANLDNNLAGVLYIAGEYAESSALYEQALALRTAELGADHPKIADTLNNIASLALARGDYPAALAVYGRALALYEAALGKDHPEIASALSNLALAHESTGDYAGAIPLLRRSIAIHEAALDPDHPQLAGSLANLALVHEGLGEYAESARLFERSLAIQEKVHGPEHPQVAHNLHNLGTVHFATGDYDEATRLFERALAIYEATMPKDHPMSAHTISSLARLHVVRGEYTDAIRLYERARAIHEASVGKDHPNTAHTLLGLAEAYTDMGRPVDAVPLLEHALRICEAAEVPADMLADIRFALARALGPADAGRARGLAEQALAALVAVPATADKQSEIRGWLATHAPR